jgi:hypothetical protein
MRLLLLLAVVAATALLASSALAQPPTGKKVHATIAPSTLTAEPQTSGAFIAWDISGETHFPRFGHLPYSGFIGEGQSLNTGLHDEEIRLTFTDEAGDSFELRGFSPLANPTPLTGTWTITGGTGSFAGVTGSGTYTFQSNVFETFPLTASDARIDLDGTISPA